MSNFGGGAPNPWGNSGSYQTNNTGNMMGGFGANNINPQAQLAMGLISNLLMQQQQQQQQMPIMGNQPMMGNTGSNMGPGCMGPGGMGPGNMGPNMGPNNMGPGGMGPNNMGPGFRGRGNYRSRNFSPQRRSRFRSPSPRRNRGPARRAALGGTAKSYRDNRRSSYNANDKRDRSRQDSNKDKKPAEKPKAESAEKSVPEDKVQTLDTKVSEQEEEECNESGDFAEENQGIDAADVVADEAAQESEIPADNDAEKSVKKEDEAKEHSKTDDKQKEKGADYEGLPPAAFRCHLCKKSMWDARSFDNHIHGIAHLRMLDETEIIYADKAKALRQECQLEEQRIQRDLEFANRPMPSRRDYCKMCDMVIYGSVLDHRRSSTHQTLKNHLHPKCSTCQIDLPSRIDLDIHVLTAAHLKRLYKDVISKPGNKKRPEKHEKPKKKIEPVGEFDATKAVGEDYLFKVTGIFCKLCRRFFLKDDEGLKTHCQTREHYDNLVQCQSESLKKEKEEEEAEAKQKAEAESEEKDEASEAKKLKVEDKQSYDPFDAEGEEGANDLNEEMDNDTLLNELEEELNQDPAPGNYETGDDGLDEFISEEVQAEEYDLGNEQPTHYSEESAFVPTPNRGRGRGGRRGGRGRGRGK